MIDLDVVRLEEAKGAPFGTSNGAVLRVIESLPRGRR
jgi:hypothetical protein